jgi:general secretion pathway protein A
MLRACCFTLLESEKPISMYLQHFNLAEKPFSTSPDPRFFYLSSQHREALAKTEYAVVEKLGLAVVYGDIGMGKTTVARRLLQKFRDEYHFNAVMLTHPAYPTENQLLRAICQEFRIGRTAKAKLDLLNLFQGYLLEQYTQGKTPVLIIDEAQTMRPPLLELLRQLLNFETNTQKLLQVVLFGQTELRERLERKPNLKSRVAMYGTLSPLSPQDAVMMLDFRYRAAGGGLLPFPPPTLEAVYRYSKGIPRSACVISDNALLKAYLQGVETVEKAMIDEIYAEMAGKDEIEVTQPEKKVGRPRKSTKKEDAHAQAAS